MEMREYIEAIAESCRKLIISKPATKQEEYRKIIVQKKIERLVLSVSTVCGCGAEKTAKLCGYTEETVGVCLTNAEVTLKAQLLSGSNI